VLQGSGSAACVQAYNGWDASLKQYAYDTAKAYGVSYELVLAIIYHESGFQASATHLNTNGTTDWGLMQINDVCFSLLQRQMGISAMSDLLDPYKGIQAGCAILAYHLRYTGNEDDALLRYQVGAGNYAYYKASGTVPLCYTNTIALRQSFYGAGV
jgi:soluble lytic murein transglycosylase-like protein